MKSKECLLIMLISMFNVVITGISIAWKYLHIMIFLTKIQPDLRKDPKPASALKTQHVNVVAEGNIYVKVMATKVRDVVCLYSKYEICIAVWRCCVST